MYFTSPINVSHSSEEVFPILRKPSIVENSCVLSTFPFLVQFVTSLFAVSAALHALLYLNLSRCCLTDDGCEKFSSEFIFLWFIYLLYHLTCHIISDSRVIDFYSDRNI